MIAVIGDKSGKSYKVELSEELIGKKVGDTINGSIMGLEGYELKITGGSDKQGFPMRGDMDGQKRVRPMLPKSIGVRTKRKGQRKRKSVRGRVIAGDISQVNMRVVKKGKGELDQLLKKEEQDKE